MNNSSLISINISELGDKYAAEEKRLTGDFLLHETSQYSDSDTNTNGIYDFYILIY